MAEERDGSQAPLAFPIERKGTPMKYMLVIVWEDADADSKMGGTKLTVRKGGEHGPLLNDIKDKDGNAKEIFAHDELDQALEMVKRLLDEAKGNFVNAKAQPPSV
jgi:hypothetical protein